MELSSISLPAETSQEVKLSEGSPGAQNKKRARRLVTPVFNSIRLMV
jgi:hypothetical protein